MKQEDLIRASKELIPKLHDDKRYVDQAEVCITELLALIDEQADQNQKLEAMLIEERAWRVAYENNMQLCECREYAICYARRELALEAPTWKHIGQLEKESLEMAISIMEQNIDSLEEDLEIKILRKLL